MSEMEEFARLIEGLTDKELKDELYTQWNSFSTPVVANEENSRRTLESILEGRDRLKVVHTGSRNNKFSAYVWLQQLLR